MKFLLRVFFWVSVIISIVLGVSMLLQGKKEGFESSSFVECRAKGFSKEFCLETPTLYFGPNACSCEDGSIGRFLPGFRGECVCHSSFV